MLNTFVPLIYLLRLPWAGRRGRWRGSRWLKRKAKKKAKKEGGWKWRERRGCMPWHVYRHTLGNDYIIPLSVVSSTWTRFQSTEPGVHTGMSGVRAAAYLCQIHACDSKVAWCNKGGGGPRCSLRNSTAGHGYIKASPYTFFKRVITTGLLDLHSRN